MKEPPPAGPGPGGGGLGSWPVRMEHHFTSTSSITIESVFLPTPSKRRPANSFTNMRIYSLLVASAAVAVPVSAGSNELSSLPTVNLNYSTIQAIGGNSTVGYYKFQNIHQIRQV
ncbi:unnamed protein product [Phytophthora fragariaefolia]|uniref:Unnamed protein product n=1 Tax=Phytophthora fragariaefolia TaxID=1490495 RepID=A0A9W6YHC4_9STRA|nr:unnamed protein product [Phytophthora fragariaefolia]